jgi:hypothetical protein
MAAPGRLFVRAAKHREIDASSSLVIVLARCSFSRGRHVDVLPCREAGSAVLGGDGVDRAGDASAHE